MGARCERPLCLVSRPGPGTSVTVVGLARSGAAAARWLLQLGCLVRVTEAARAPALEAQAERLTADGALVELGGHSERFVEGARLLVISPGVPLDAPPVQWAREAGIPVVGEMELGSWYCSGRIVAVTGSNGKSTVVTLVGEILKAAGKEAVVCGNIGEPLCGFLDRIRPSTIVVLEVSSFQLEASLAFHPEIGCLLNVTTNHLDRHGSFARYRAAKARLFAYQPRNDWAVLNADDAGSSSLNGEVRSRRVGFSRRGRVVGACAVDGWLTLTLPGASGPICRREALPRPGDHHEENALAAACICGLLGVDPQVSGRVLSSFPGLPHRQEVVATIRGVTFVNDSKSTTVASALSAIQAAPGPVVLIAGGRDKGSDFRQLRPWAKKLRGAVLIGEDGPRIAAQLKGAVPHLKAPDLPSAVEAAFGMAKAGEWVLFSPMCTSFDMFRDFEERGERFSEAVHQLP
ncbi:MAG: UDP-N-acetylmuramoyl-L-alanine--D-glutamate ligase [Candidatus Omnitrophica bacterium]|nr:UDP-N-acetylmuramoyl-L-alanine--D-glutamate ligase [Candidatus Omnitrophota bacterium]